MATTKSAVLLRNTLGKTPGKILKRTEAFTQLRKRPAGSAPLKQQVPAGSSLRELEFNMECSRLDEECTTDKASL